MKKTIYVLLVCSCLPISAFAYGYRSYSDELIPTWFTILMLVWAILNIILFFKIWGATDNIYKLKATICDKAQTANKADYLKKLYLLNKVDEAYEFLNDRLTDKIIAIYKECKNQSNGEGEIKYGEMSISMEEAFERRKTEAIKEYKSDYALFGKCIPAKLMEIKMDELQIIG